MAYVEPQHNAAGPTSATRGVLMVDRGKGEGLRARSLHAGSTSDSPPDALNSKADEGSAAPQSADGSAARSGLSDHTRDRLAAQLRAMYDTIAQQPVPDRFAELIAKLDASDSGKA
jgi:hypothetical protein